MLQPYMSILCSDGFLCMYKVDKDTQQAINKNLFKNLDILLDLFAFKEEKNIVLLDYNNSNVILTQDGPILLDTGNKIIKSNEEWFEHLQDQKNAI